MKNSFFNIIQPTNFPVMKIVALPFLICLLALSSCKKDDPALPPAPTPFCHQTSATVNFISGSTSNNYQVDFTFNDDHKLIRDGLELTYEWSANQVIQRSFINGSVDFKTTYVLDNAGRAVSQTSTNAAGGYLSNGTYEYDASGHLVKVVEASTFGGSTTTKEWSQDNLIKEVNTTQFGDVRTTTNTYHQILISPASFTRLPIFGKDSKSLLASNLNVYSWGGSSSYTFQYELDALGNVTKEISNGVDLGQTSTLTAQYTYQGCQ